MEITPIRYIKIENDMGFICEMHYNEHINRYTVKMGKVYIETETQSQMKNVLNKLGWVIEAKWMPTPQEKLDKIFGNNE